VASAAVYFHPLFLEHDTGMHPESSQRLVAARRALVDSGSALEWIEPEAATREMLARIHTPGHIENVRRVAEGGGGHLDWDTVVSPASYDAALHAAGAGVQAVERAVRGGGPAFLLVRPPGHHARSDQGMGFCLFNNIAVAAAHAIAALGLERVLIVDWDVHHGNGTQESFFEDPHVLFFSMHLGHHYPGTGSLNEIGEGEGEGYTGNLPLEHGAGDGAASLFFSRVVEPPALEFDPQLVLVSAGYDSSAGDPLGGLMLSSGAFRWMTGRLTALCDRLGAAGPICFLEGGYDTGLLSSGIVATIQGFSAGPGTLDVAASPSEAAAVELLIRRLAPYWPSLTA
jgi:acetoin utilization deacetylase AcuC-like enzyme